MAIMGGVADSGGGFSAWLANMMSRQQKWLRQISTVTLLILPVSLVPSVALSFEFADLWRRSDQQAVELLNQSRPAEAAQLFEDSRWRGVSHYRAGDYEAAAQAFAEQQGDLFNQGTAAVQAGDYQGAIDKFEQQLSAQPDHQDALHNLEIARKLLEDSESDENSEQQDGDSNSDEQNDEQSEGGDSGDSGDQNQQDQSQQGDDQQQPGQQSQQDQRDQQGQDQQAGDSSDQPSDSDAEPAAEPESQAGQQQAEAQGDSDESETDSAQSPAGTESESETQAAEAAASEAEQAMSESEQATEQWLRQIPDDPARLLRGKIRLKHNIDYRNIGDMEQAW